MKKRGISLIVLIVTIIVVIILAAVVILTLSKNNPIESAKEARFKEDVRTFQDELALTVSKQYTAAGGHRDTKISTSNFDEIKEFIPSFSEKYRDKFIIQDDELVFSNKVTEKEKYWCENLNLKGELYTELEYIKGNGKQYIDTTLKANNNMDIDFSFKTDVNSITKRAQEPLNGEACSVIFGVTDNNTHKTFAMNFGGNVGETYKYFWKDYAYGYGGNNLGRSINTTSKTNVKCIDNKWYVDDVYIGTSNFSEPWESGNNLVILGNNYSGMVKCFYENLYIYYFKIYDNDVLVRDFIPVLDSNKKPALYDKVEGKFYYNQGTEEDFEYKLKE